MYGTDDRDKLTQGKSWVVHTSGELAILVARGPSQYTDGLAHRLFCDGRLHLVSFHDLAAWISRTERQIF